jgi:hypothetical protein
MPGATRHLLATPKQSEGGSRRASEGGSTLNHRLSTSSAMWMGFRESMGQPENLAENEVNFAPLTKCGLDDI